MAMFWLVFWTLFQLFSNLTCDMENNPICPHLNHYHTMTPFDAPGIGWLYWVLTPL